MSESFSELFEQSLANQRIRPGMILTGLVIDVGSDMVIVNVGLKSEAAIPLADFVLQWEELYLKQAARARSSQLIPQPQLAAGR